MTKQEKLDQFRKLHGTLKMTFMFPKVAPSRDEEQMPLTVKDVDFVETEVLRQFFINMQRVVDFEFVAYPEDRACDDARKFVGAGEGDMVFAFFGFVNRVKGLEDLLAAKVNLRERDIKTHLLMVGERIGSSDATNIAYAQEIDALMQSTRDAISGVGSNE